MAVYLIHFAEKFRHAQHYLGYAKDVEKRLARHRSGDGAKLLRAVQRAGIEWHVVRVWLHGDRALERQLKRRGGHGRICPLCTPSHAR